TCFGDLDVIAHVNIPEDLVLSMNSRALYRFTRATAPAAWSRARLLTVPFEREFRIPPLVTGLLALRSRHQKPRCPRKRSLFLWSCRPLDRPRIQGLARFWQYLTWIAKRGGQPPAPLLPRIMA